MYQVFEHTADLGIRVRAADLPTLFADAATGLSATLLEDLTTVRPQVTRHIELQNADLVYLLFDWLNELLYLFDGEHLVLSKFDVRLEGPLLHATVVGEAFDPDRHRVGCEVKAITYHELKVERDGADWLAEFIVDI
jgi:SHS2 domain-containing protein